MHPLNVSLAVQQRGDDLGLDFLVFQLRTRWKPVPTSAVSPVKPKTWELCFLQTDTGLKGFLRVRN